MSGGAAPYLCLKRGRASQRAKAHGRGGASKPDAEVKKLNTAMARPNTNLSMAQGPATRTATELGMKAVE